jgi:hypothetical protein
MELTLKLDLAQAPDRALMRLWLETRADDPARAVQAAEAERDAWRANAEKLEALLAEARQAASKAEPDANPVAGTAVVSNPEAAAGTRARETGRLEPGDVVGSRPAPAPEASVEPEEAPAEAPAGDPGEDLDPKRFWTDADKIEAWRLHQAGLAGVEIARLLRREARQVTNWLNHVKHGRQKVPAMAEAPETAPEATPAPGTAVAVRAEAGMPAVRMAAGFDDTERSEIAIDPAIRAKWQAELDERQRMKAVAGRVP